MHKCTVSLININTLSTYLFVLYAMCNIVLVNVLILYILKSQPCLTLHNPVDCSTPGPPSLTISRNLPKFMSIASVMPSNHLFLCHPLLILPSIFPSIRVFANESALHIRWPKYWSFSFSISLSNEYSGLISFKIDWFDLLAVQGILRSLFERVGSSPQVAKRLELQF